MRDQVYEIIMHGGHPEVPFRKQKINMYESDNCKQCGLLYCQHNIHIIESQVQELSNWIPSSIRLEYKIEGQDSKYRSFSPIKIHQPDDSGEYYE